MRCLIIDDEKLAREEMRQLLCAHSDLEIAGEAGSVELALELTARLQPEVAFVDVQLRGESGFDYVSRIPEPRPHIVFVTAHENFALQGFECEATDYLLKPVAPERLARSLRRLRGRKMPELSNAGPGFVKVGDRYVNWREIERIVSDGNYTRIQLRQGTFVVVLRTLKEWLALAPGGVFLQIHRAMAIRRDAVRELRLLGAKKCDLILHGGDTVSVGRNYQASVRSAFAGL